MSKEKQIEEMDERAYDCDECEHFWVCYKIHQHHVQQINTGLYCPSFKRKQSEGEWQKAPDGTHWCSECGHDATYTFDGTEICGVSCPFCGAKMKGGAE